MAQLASSIPTADQTKATLRLFWQQARQYPKFLWPLATMVPLVVLIGDFAVPYVTAQVLQKLSSGQFDHHHVFNSFGTLLALYAAGTVISGIIGWRIVIWLVWNLELRAVSDLSRRVFDHLIGLSANFHNNRFGGSLVSQANKLNGSYVRLADAMIFNLIPLTVSVAAIIAVLAPRSPQFVAVLIGLTIVYLLGTAYFSKAVRLANVRESSLQSKQTGLLADAITNVFAVKTFAAARAESRRYQQLNDQVVRAGYNSMKATLIRENFAAVLTHTMSILALAVAVIGVGLWRADVATVFLMVSYTSSLSARLWDFQNVMRQYNRAMGDASDMVEILQIKPDIKDPGRPEKSRMTAGEIQFQAMTFTHGEASDPLFEGLDLHISPGEKIGLVGRSGSGKTTLTRLLLRLSDLDAGAITIDGQNIAAVTQDDLRRAISYVPQEPMLFHRTLRENIAYGKPKATEADVIAAATRAHAAEFIDQLPHGYDTLVGERGIKLSGGQRQRIAIARAMIKDAPILVLDEATSALDSESERLIQDALMSLMEGRSAIVIAHRLSTIQRLDRIVVLDNGHVIEQGTHAQLIAAGGHYAKLWAHQSGGFVKEDDEA